MRLAWIGLGLLAVGGAALGSGLLPLDDALALWQRLWPILAYVGAITVVAELAAEAGVFRVVAERVARLARGWTFALWLLSVGLAVVVTAFLSLDTTAVLLTPIVVELASHAGVRPLPFALATVWLANTASLWLPVSNLTNLLAMHRLGLAHPGEFVALLWAPALVATLVPVAVVALLLRRELHGRFEPPAREPVDDRFLLRIAAATLAALLPLLLLGIEPWLPAAAAAAILLVAFAVRRRGALRFGLVPLPLVVFALGLFLAVDALHAIGATAPLLDALDGGASLGDLLLLALGGAASANAIDNLPAYLALEPAADSPLRLAALLIGVNVGPLVTPWASLATLLWHARLSSLGVELRWGRYAALGLAAAPLTVALATLALWLAHR